MGPRPRRYERHLPLNRKQNDMLTPRTVVAELFEEEVYGQIALRGPEQSERRRMVSRPDRYIYTGDTASMMDHH